MGLRTGPSVLIDAVLLAAPQDVIDALEPGVIEPIEDLGIGPAEDADAMAGPLGYLPFRYSRVQTNGHTCVTQVVRTLEQDRAVLFRGETDSPSGFPYPVVGASTDRLAVDATKDAAVQCSAAPNRSMCQRRNWTRAQGWFSLE
jgi:hypothetical protein